MEANVVVMESERGVDYDDELLLCDCFSTYCCYYIVISLFIGILLGLI